MPRLWNSKKPRPSTRFEEQQYGDFTILDAQQGDWETARLAAGRAHATRGGTQNEGSQGTAEKTLWVHRPVVNVDPRSVRRETIPSGSSEGPLYQSATRELYIKHLAMTEGRDQPAGSENDGSSPAANPSEQRHSNPDDHTMAQSLSQRSQTVATRGELWDITVAIMMAGQQFSQLSGTDPNDPVGAVRHVLKAFEDLANEKPKKTSHFRRGKSKTLKDPDHWERKFELCEKNLQICEAKLDASKKEVLNLKIQKEALEETRTRLERDKEKLKQEWKEKLEASKNSNLKEVAKWKEKADKTRGDMEHSERQHSRITRENQESHQLKIHRLRAELGADLRQATETAKAQAASAERKHREALRAERDDKDKRLLEQQQRHDREIDVVRKKLDDMIQSFELERKELKLAFAAQTQDLQRNNESLTGALVRRDHFKGLSDSALRARFSSLSVKLGSIAFKADWSRNLEETWPFPENSLHRLCPKDTGKTNVRKLKQQIIQNSLWFVLYYYIFSTPFRILGTSGKDLDEGWFSEFGGSLFMNETSEWPPPTNESEKKRHEEAKSCLELIQNAGQISDENEERRQSYIQSVQQIVEHVRELVGRVAHVDPGDEQKFEELVDEAAKLWIEACSQRCRFRVVLPRGAEDVVSRSHHDFGSMSLIVKPSLIRWGNSQGQDLTKEEFLNDWAGEVTEYEYVGSIV